MKKLFTLICTLLLSYGMIANNVTISNLSLTDRNKTENFVLVNLDLSWDNSWRTSSSPLNWDAAWVFVKFRVNGSEWQHAWLNDAGHTTPSGGSMEIGLLSNSLAFNMTTNPALGAFLYRSTDGTGTNNFKGMQLRWNYGANGVNDTDQVEIRAYAVEMVFVPQGSFYVGSGGTETGSFTRANNTTGVTVPFQIGGAPVMMQGNDAGSSAANLSARGQFDLTGTTTASLGTGFPTGYRSFYCMKYEISQLQYADFLNTLTAAQTAARYPGELTFRHAITVNEGNYSTSAPDVACNFLSWMDGAAYADWAGLRPMTELEFEKACRGSASPLAGIYAWGTTTITAASGISNAGNANEVASNSGSNAVYNSEAGVQGPLRVGAMARSGNTREQSGATWYGIMEMSGNLSEHTVTVANTTGRAYTGTPGNGILSLGGNADVSAWPGLISGEVSDATGTGFRGGDWSNAAPDLTIADRATANLAATDRQNIFGFRAARTVNDIPTVATDSVGNITLNTAVAYANVVNDGGLTVTARGVCWSTTTSPMIALSTKTSDGSGTGAFTSDITGLSPNITYYVRAYATSANGTAYGNEISFSTLFVCGTSTFSVSHLVSGGVAPVDKTTTYGTVTNIPGETSKCWITHNLGATQQAASLTDATEASAGWYWQFNRKQGYKHDGTTRTPNSTWTTSISETSDWVTTNDACTLELGSPWRIPTNTEWLNVYNAGGWSNGTGQWSSALKIHEAGYLIPDDGTLSDRGAYGFYWSSKQNSLTGSVVLAFGAGYGYMLNSTKSYGHSLRCIRE